MGPQPSHLAPPWHLFSSDGGEVTPRPARSRRPRRWAFGNGLLEGQCLDTSRKTQSPPTPMRPNYSCPHS